MMEHGLFFEGLYSDSMMMCMQIVDFVYNVARIYAI